MMSDSAMEKLADSAVDEKKTNVVANNDLVPSSGASKTRAKFMSRFCVSVEDDPLLFFNVGGHFITTRRSTCIRMPNTVLALLCVTPWSETFPRDPDDRLFLDCDAWAFEYLLNQLRDWSSTRRVFDLPRDPQERERFRTICRQLHFDEHLVDGVERSEKFNKICGHILLDEKGLLARHAGTYRYAECRGMNVYSSGIHRITLTVKHQSMDKYNTFIGIIWSTSPMQEKSFETSTAYGWAGQGQVYLKGVPATFQGYGGYDSDICTNDILELTLNCQLSFISLTNDRTKKTYQIPVDTQEGCPLPWQLHINLYGPDDRVKIINPS